MVWKSIKKILNNPYRVFVYLAMKFNYFPKMNDEKYVKLVYRGLMGKKLNLSNPRTYNEKLQWLKLYDHNPNYTTMVDKYAVKDYVANIIGSQYIVKTLGVWDRFDDIDFDSLPKQFVLKCTHDSGGLVICDDISRLDKAAAKKKIEQSLKRDYYSSGREWPYKNVRPRIIAEEYLEDSKTKELRDYKFFVFNGVVKMMFVATERQNQEVDTKFDFFNEDYVWIDMRQGHPNANVHPEKPEQFELMKELASKLGKNLCEARIDFYEVDGKVYFGEITFFHHGGWTPFDPPKYDNIFGDWIQLPERK